jgi:hypothetical protein
MRTSIAFLSGVLVGGVVTAVAFALGYYHYNFVQLGGPAGAVAREYEVVISGIQNASTGAPRTPQDIAEHQLKLAIGQSVLAANAYCAMNEGDRKVTQLSASKLRMNPQFTELAASEHRDDAKAAVDYLAKAQPSASCDAFHHPA